VRLASQLPTEIEIIGAQICAIQQDIEENKRYKTKLLKRLEPLEEELKACAIDAREESESVVSTSQRSLREGRPGDRHAHDSKRAPSSKPGHLSAEMQVKHSINGYLAELNALYHSKLEVLKNPFYDKENLENSLQRFILSDCIEYRDYGIEAYEILSMHEKILEVTLAEKKTRQEVELKENLRVLPILHEEAQRKKEELRELSLILDRQKSVCPRHPDHPTELSGRPPVCREAEGVPVGGQPAAGEVDHAEAVDRLEAGRAEGQATEREQAVLGPVRLDEAEGFRRELEAFRLHAEVVADPGVRLPSAAGPITQVRLLYTDILN